MSLEELYPGRVFLGVGSGEAVNLTPLGLEWPSFPEQKHRFSAGLDAITRVGREPGEIIFQAGFTWAETDEAAIQGARRWKLEQVGATVICLQLIGQADPMGIRTYGEKVLPALRG